MFHKKVIQSVNEHHSAYDEKIWVQIEKKLDAKKKRRLLLFLFTGIVLAGVMLTFLMKNPDSKTPKTAERTEVPTP